MRNTPILHLLWLTAYYFLLCCFVLYFCLNQSFLNYIITWFNLLKNFYIFRAVYVMWHHDLYDGCRERTKLVYTMYSRKDEEEVWKNLQKLHVNFAILEESWCTRRAKCVAIKCFFVSLPLLKYIWYLWTINIMWICIIRKYCIWFLGLMCFSCVILLWYLFLLQIFPFVNA